MQTPILRPRHHASRLRLMAAMLLAALPPVVRAQVNEINVGVRADVEWNDTGKAVADEKANLHPAALRIGES